MMELLKRLNEKKENTRKEMEKLKEKLLREINYNIRERRTENFKQKQRRDWINW